MPLPPVSTSPSLGKLEPHVLVREAHQEDLACSRLLDHYFVCAASGIGRDLETTAIRTLLGRTPEATGWCRLFAQAEDGVNACLMVEDKPWDTGMLSVQTKNLTVLASAPTPRSRREISSHLIGHWLREHPAAEPEYIVTRVPAGDVSLLHALEDHGFRLLVPMVTLGKTPPGSERVVLPVGVEVSEVEPREVDQVEKISAKAFVWGRFAVDPGVCPEAAEIVHGTWARNCCLGLQADRVLVARTRGEILGFIALKFLMADNTRVGSIELIATSETSRSMGVGRALVRSGSNWIARFSQHVVVRTELPNTLALRLYEGEGFRVLNSSLYLSLWRN